ncbi:hypothetical protein K488DRAFT_86671 [Vararia minispora EC-137]|uniref:Uncharacterized protein n=1 Tax=Vararia minispora EC-137 TaxID=1314806 RepID=A0ACB8QIR6_9AGAM|nr:hypothetical protein K488DRAFT_86671 [Vararia minispora EC-137]
MHRSEEPRQGFPDAPVRFNSFKPRKRPRVKSQSNSSVVGGQPSSTLNGKRPTRGTATYTLPKDVLEIDEVSVDFSLALSHLIMTSTHALAKDGRRVTHVRRHASNILLDWILDLSVVDDVLRGDIPLPSFNPAKEDEEGGSQPMTVTNSGTAEDPLVISDTDYDSGDADDAVLDDKEPEDDTDELMDDISEHFASSTIDSPPRRPMYVQPSASPPRAGYKTLRPTDLTPQFSFTQQTALSSSVRPTRRRPEPTTSPQVMTTSGSTQATRSQKTPHKRDLQSRSCSPPRRASGSALRKAPENHFPYSSASSPRPRSIESAREERQSAGVKIARISIPIVGHARARRLLAPHDYDSPIATVAMSGDLQFVDKAKRQCISQWSLPRRTRVTGEMYNVQEAFVLGEYGVIGYRDSPINKSTSACEISILSLKPSTKPARHDITARVSPSPDGKIASISSLAPVAHNGARLKFLSGGLDGRVHLWKVDGANGVFRAKSEALSLALPSTVTALAFVPAMGTVYGGSYGRIIVGDLEKGARGPANILSNHVFHIHVMAEKLILLEVNHLEEQMQLFDLRVHEFNQAPALRFGYRYRREDGDNRRELRYVRGNASRTYFARGYKDGVVRLWDIRMMRRGEPMATLKISEEAEVEVAHVIFPDPTSTRLAAFGPRFVTFVDPV